MNVDSGIDAKNHGSATSRATSRVSSDLVSLATRFDLPREAAPRLQALVDLVCADDRAPTTIREPRAILRDHIADSLVALDVPAVRAAASIADLGAGAGFPGLPLAIALPTASVALVDSSSRKIEFIKRAIERSRINNARALHVRVESWTEGREEFDLVTARAVAPLPVVAEYAAPLLRIGGALLVWRGRPDPLEEAAGARAADELGLMPAESLPVSPYPEARDRNLQLMLKVSPTPSRFPRRPGVAAKKPLGQG